MTIWLLCASGALAADAPLAVDLPAQSLQTSLLWLAEHYGFPLIAPAEVVAGRTAPAIAGTWTAEEALREVLRGSGLEGHRLNSGAVLIRTVPPKPPPVVVEPAAPDPEPDPFDGGEIIVAGTKDRSTLHEEAVSVEVFSEQRIDGESIFELDELLLRTPNVTLSGPTSNVTIRGISRNGTTGTDNTVAGVTSNVYSDGAPVSTIALTGGFESLWDVGQVEVLRGAQSVTQGRNALAGSIYLSTRDPTYHWEGRARARAGNFDTRQYAIAVSGPLIDDQLAFRVSSDLQESDGVVRRAEDGSEFDPTESLLVRGKLLAEPEAIEGLRVELLVEHAESEVGGTSSFVNAPFGADDPAFASFDFTDRKTFNDPQRNDTEVIRVVGDVTHEFDEKLKLRLIGTYEDAERRQRVGSLRDPGSFDRNLESIENTATYSGEARLELELDWLRLVGGGYYFEDRRELGGTQVLLLAPLSMGIPIDPIDSRLSADQDVDSKTRNWALFGSARADFHERFSVEIALRYDNETTRTKSAPVTNLFVDPPSCVALTGITPPPTCIALVRAFSSERVDPNQSGGFGVWLPQAELTYRFTSNHSVFVTAQRGYRAGGTFLQRSGERFVVGEFDPEFLDQVEVGFRTRWRDRTLTFNANAFYSKYEDQQLTVPGPSMTLFDSQVVNAGESTIAGVEATAEWKPISGLQLYASFGYLFTEFDDFPFALPGMPFENLEGNELPRAPEYSVSVGGRYQHDTGLFVDGGVTVVDGYETDIANLGQTELGPGLAEKVGSRTIVNLRGGYAHEHFMLYGFVTNALDEDEPVGVNLGSVNRNTGTVSLFGNPSQSLTPPRMVGAALEVYF
ncbi:MAG: TonB-dependent receptor [Myxococcota bacterium]